MSVLELELNERKKEKCVRTSTRRMSQGRKGFLALLDTRGRKSTCCTMMIVRHCYEHRNLRMEIHVPMMLITPSSLRNLYGHLRERMSGDHHSYMSSLSLQHLKTD
jgi:hypothetical protein